MAEGGTYTFSDPDEYAAAFANARINFTVTGAGDFTARLTRLKLQHLEMFCCRETVPRIASISLPSERIVLSFPIGSSSFLFSGSHLRKGDVVFHGRGECIHQCSAGACEWGMISVAAEQLATRIALPDLSRVVRPPAAEAVRFQRLVRRACQLAESGRKFIGAEVARALEQEMFHAVVPCLAASYTHDIPGMRHRLARLMVRFEEVLPKYIDQKLSLRALCAELRVPERTLRAYCDKVLGVSPAQYIWLQRLNRARAALQCANPSITTVSEVARNNQFLEPGRFSVTYRTLFGESPSVTLQRDVKHKKLAETA